jgi:hypothetical protein
MSESYDFDFLVGEPVNQVWVWGPIRLVIESISANVDLLRVGFADSDGRNVEIDAIKRPTEAGPLLGLLQKHVTSAKSTDGVLVLRFDDGSEVRGYPDERYDSWSVDRDGGPSITCGPGGELTSL